MKTIKLTLVALMLATFSLAQDQSVVQKKDLSSNLVGSWQHLRSVYPTGEIMTYTREFDLYEDGTGLCTRLSESDTVAIKFEWEVKDSTIYLYTLNNKGKRIEADAQLITHIDEAAMHLDEPVDEGYLGKVCMYRRKDSKLAKY
ncbi:hypothetical protein K6119_14635 [Paracrocinitomix mangrovi]|uniref:hypothetical protein n=1 Tax=Paracrocinitomix mangrovi TaxID=2862509 RepID=UPI001C8D3ED9|nr:hypothetical protein [Paracrocinitomix mangrovi]UKN00969.1 hypothetical protein K6119_14635 [Paracrocinitomix mangrovi]